jgi:hypothetical protein
MTTQQVDVLYPYVYEMKIPDPLYYPDISLTTIKTTNNTFAMGSDLNFYTGVIGADGSSAYLGKYQRQDFHEHYFTVKPAEDISASTTYTYSQYTVSQDSVSNVLLPDIRTYIFNTKLYVLSMSQGDVSHTYPLNTDETIALTSDATMKLEQFDIVNRLGDVEKNWEVLGPSLNFGFNQFGTSELWNVNQYGLANASDADEGYIYHYLYTNSSPHKLVIKKIDKSDGTIIDTTTVDNPGPSTGSHSYVLVEKPSYTSTDVFIVTKGSLGLQIGHAVLQAGDISMSTTLQTMGGHQSGVNVNASNPISYSYIDGDGVGNNLLIYSVVGIKHKIFFTDNVTAETTGIKHFVKPLNYSIDKTERFEEAISSASTDYACVRNPLNTNFIYMAYITADSQIRVIKLYRHINTDGISVYLIMWASRIGAFADNGSSYLYSNTDTDSNGLSMIVDKCGDIYVLARKSSDNITKMWKIMEFNIDLGHTYSDVVADVSVIPNMLKNIDDNYSIITPERYLLANLPVINNVIISSVTSGEVINIVFKYLNYNVFEANDELTATLKILITDALTLLYTGSSVSVLNLDGEGSHLTGTSESLTIQIPSATVVKPCVLRGTEVVRLKSLRSNAADSYEFVPIEKIQVGDYVLNHDSKPALVLDHTKDIISTNDWTSPYIIPIDYFGKDRPYKTLYISGDHGIKNHGKVVYPYRMYKAFKRLVVGSVVEYHHLLLENDSWNFYVANGLLVDSLHNGIYLT